MSYTYYITHTVFEATINIKIEPQEQFRVLSQFKYVKSNCKWNGLLKDPYALA